jgi:preprotein translocase subunit SecE
VLGKFGGFDVDFCKAFPDRMEGDVASIVNRMTGFIKEVRVESTKVTWPSRKELRESTIVVVVAVSFIAVFIGLADRILAFLLNMLL